MFTWISHHLLLWFFIVCGVTTVFSLIRGKGKEM